MNEGVKLLLERIKTHPEEFMKGGRWIRILAEYNEYIPDELKPLTNEARKLVADEFTRDVMTELLDSDENNQDLMDEVMNHVQLHRRTHETIFGKLKYDAIEKNKGD